MADVEDNGGVFQAAYADNLITLSIVNEQVAQMEESMLSHPGYKDVSDDMTFYDEDGGEDKDKDEDEDDNAFSEIAFPDFPSSNMQFDTEI